MRNLFLLILLIILLAFAYQTWILEPDNPVAATYMDQDVPELSVVAPPAVKQSSEPGDSAAEPAPIAEKVYQCMRVGPFPRESDADVVRATLQGKEATVRQITEESQVWVGYWVQTAGQGSRATAEAIKEDLAAGGLPDAYILPKDSNYRISLGVFRLRASANTVVRQAHGMGVDTRVIERYQPGSNYWLLVRVPADKGLKPGDLQGLSGQILRTEALSCETAGV
jgi:hypothetical protein